MEKEVKKKQGNERRRKGLRSFHQGLLGPSFLSLLRPAVFSFPLTRFPTSASSPSPSLRVATCTVQTLSPNLAETLTCEARKERKERSGLSPVLLAASPLLSAPCPPFLLSSPLTHLFPSPQALPFARLFKRVLLLNLKDKKMCVGRLEEAIVGEGRNRMRGRFRP